MKFLRWVPNALTLSRLFLAIPVTMFLFADRPGVALFLLLVAAATDLLDGFLARNFNLRTVIGSWLDPAADKVLITTVLITFTVKQELPVWFCVLTVARDVGIATGVFYLVGIGRKIRIQPLLTGKLATIAQNAVLLLALLAEFGRGKGALGFFVVLSAGLTLISVAMYALNFVRVYRYPAAWPSEKPTR
jgi:cardiolipin synthase (CMP-forming)